MQNVRNWLHTLRGYITQLRKRPHSTHVQKLMPSVLWAGQYLFGNLTLTTVVYHHFLLNDVLVPLEHVPLHQ
jgi:hypothetical protein